MVHVDSQIHTQSCGAVGVSLKSQVVIKLKQSIALALIFIALPGCTLKNCFPPFTIDKYLKQGTLYETIMNFIKFKNVQETFLFFFAANPKKQIMTPQKRCNKPTLIIDGSSLSKFQRIVFISGL